MKTRDKGQRAEALAAAYLSDRGYQILETNYRVRQGEIDLVAEDGGVLVLVEVRSRQSAAHGDPLETIDWRKRRRLIHAAKHLVHSRGWQERFIRFDVIGMVYQPELRIELVRDAFTTTD
jgi:putative endonuclease